MSELTLGVIGGSGLYAMEELTEVEEIRLQTPFGEPSDAYICGRLGAVRLVFLPRHGRGHRYLPSEVPYRANIYGMKMLGVDRILSVSAVGSMKEQIAPGHMVVPDQFIDRTTGKRANSFFGDGIVGHVQFADPLCHRLFRPHRQSAICVKVGATVLSLEFYDFWIKWIGEDKITTLDFFYGIIIAFKSVHRLGPLGPLAELELQRLKAIFFQGNLGNSCKMVVDVALKHHLSWSPVIVIETVMNLLKHRK